MIIVIIMILMIIIMMMIITMFTQGYLFNTRGAIINEGPVSINALYYNKILQSKKII